MHGIKLILRLIGITILLLLALGLDYLMYLFTNTCVACTSFSQFIASPVSISGPILVTAGSMVLGLKTLAQKRFRKQKSA